MGNWKDFGWDMASAAGGQIIGMGLDFLTGGTRRRKKAQQELMQQQYALEINKMNHQAELNRQQAEYSQELQKGMWDYTNYENQKKHLENAGLNPALLYGMSGGGGATAGGASAAGVGNGETQAVAMGLQAKMLEAEIRRTNAEAMKLEQEAGTENEKQGSERTKQTLDAAMTKVAEANEKLKITENERGKIGIKIDNQTLELQKVQINSAKESLAILQNEKEISNKTKDETINKIIDECQLPYFERLWYMARINNMDAQTEKEKELKEQIIKSTAYIAYHYKSERMMAEASKEAAAAQTSHSKAYQQSIDQEAERIQGQLARWAKENHLTDAQIAQILSSETRQWIHGTIELGVDLLSIISPKKFFQMVTKDTWVKGKGRTKTEATTYDQWEKREWKKLFE